MMLSRKHLVKTGNIVTLRMLKRLDGFACMYDACERRCFVYFRKASPKFDCTNQKG